MGEFGLGVGSTTSSPTPPKNPRKPHVPRKRSVAGRRSRQRSSPRISRRGRRRTSGRASKSPRRRPAFADGLRHGDYLMIIKTIWWLNHGLIFAMVMHLETTNVHNYVALVLFLPEFSLNRLRIGHIFDGGEGFDFFTTTVLLGYTFIVAIFMGGIGIIMWAFLIVSSLDNAAVFVGIGILSAILSLVVVPVDVVRVISLSVGWVLLMGLSTFYVHMGLTFVPGLYVLILAVSAADAIYAYLENKYGS